MVSVSGLRHSNEWPAMAGQHERLVYGVRFVESLALGLPAERLALISHLCNEFGNETFTESTCKRPYDAIS
jgi:hypothetical protein